MRNHSFFSEFMIVIKRIAYCEINILVLARKIISEGYVLQILQIQNRELYDKEKGTQVRYYENEV